jgi:hypothetical protein
MYFGDLAKIMLRFMHIELEILNYLITVFYNFYNFYFSILLH